jgi:hypothetical protein
MKTGTNRRGKGYYFDDFAAAGKKVRISWVGGFTIIR